MSLFANCWSQFYLDHFGRCLKLFISTERTSSHEFASQFGLARFLYAKNTKKTRGKRVGRASLFEWTSDQPRLIASRKGALTASRIDASCPSNNGLITDCCFSRINPHIFCFQYFNSLAYSKQVGITVDIHIGDLG